MIFLITMDHLAWGSSRQANTPLAAYPMVPQQMIFLPHLIFDLCHWEILS